MTRGSSHPWIRVLATVVSAASLAGCQADPGPVPAPSSPQVGTVSPAPSDPPGRWRGLSATCPTLDSPAARDLKATGEGTTDGPLTGPDLLVRCGWGPDGQTRPFVDISITVFTVPFDTVGGVEQRARDYYAESVAKSRKETSSVLDAEGHQSGTVQTLSGVGDEASMVSWVSGMVAYAVVRSSNAVLTVRIYDTQSVDGGVPGMLERLAKRHPAVRQLTTDVLDDLR